MAFVITQPCIGTKDTACVEVCPVDCIHPGKSEEQYDEVEQLYINPDECIECGACEPVCPVQAIFPEDDVPDDAKSFIEKNADWYSLSAEDFQAKWGSPGKKS
ncbi:MAG TPA: ferredoxin family protein [Firmicutes bacterium]|nr:ferredoxin family protein [Bacillota bacterium]